MKLLLLFVIDIIVVFNAVLLSFKLSPSFTMEVIVDGAIEAAVLPIASGISLTVALTLYIFSCGDTYLRIGRIESTARSLIGCFVGTLLFAALYGVSTNQLFGRYIILFTVVFSWLVVGVIRITVDEINFFGRKKIHFIGTDQEYHVLNNLIQASTQGIRIDSISKFSASAEPPPGGALFKQCIEGNISDIVVGRVVGLSQARVSELMSCTMGGLNVIDISSFCEKHLRLVFNKGIDESWFWQYDCQYLDPFFSIVKRTVDVFVSLVGLILAFPLMCLIAVALKLQDGGRVIYSQVRVGYMGRPFRIYKFRTMRTDAEKKGAQWAKKGDARVTAIGRLLRTTRLDEVPQFINIIRGDMSFIGPRPERPEMVFEIEQRVSFFRCRTLVKPGLTGWAQINYPYGASFDDAEKKLSYDLYYIKHASLFLDLVILLRTTIAMIKGAR